MFEIFYNSDFKELELKAEDKYDLIVIGTGTVGSTIAQTAQALL